ncbi:MAG: translation initiation factor IF-2 [Coriobacteriales bacterium]|jgi:translation initiation factor IF-2|nr:translation initiation factor IF-2 [Coriobacteriales bacterium]
MAKTRVHELAKELNIDSKEFLELLIEMKVPVKNHASTLEDAYVDRIKKKLAPIIAERTAQLEAKRIEEEARLVEEEQKAREIEEAERKAAVQKERALREQERLAREAQAAEDSADAAATDEAEASDSAREEEPEKKVIKPFAGLLSQIEAEHNRLEAEKTEQVTRATTRSAGQKGRGEAAASDALSPDAGDVQIGVEGGAGAGAGAGAEAGAGTGTGVEAARTAGTGAGAGVEAARTAGAARLSVETDETPRGRAARKAAGAEGRQEEGEAGDLSSRQKSRKGKGRASNRSLEGLEDFDAFASSDEDGAVGVDRYRKMAEVAEKLQRDRVLADARAAVAAATGEGEGRRQKRKKKREDEAREKAEAEAIEKGIDPELLLDDSFVQVTTGVTVQEFADLLKVSANDIVKRLFLLSAPLTVTQTMTDDLVELIAEDMGRTVRIVSPEEEYAIHDVDAPEDMSPRPPVVTVMGHVDHGKTSLLDAIRSTGVVATEAGGITQHIGASVVEIKERQITFIDTPGHEAFTAMRARGAKVTDVVVLVVAADDGVMPQTVEAIHHAEAAGVPIVVAVNKVDKPGANPERVRQELTEHNIVPEEWGGQNMFVEVSAKQRTGIDDLLETILLQADVLELQANPHALASGFVIEAKLDKGRGPVATVLVQRGTLKGGDAVVVGTAHGRVRALVDPKGNMVESARPADPVEILGLGSVPDAGDEFRVFGDERDARNLAEDRALRKRLAEQQQKGHASLEDLFARIGEGISELNLVVKADVQGSIEALQDALDKMDQSEVRINVIHSAVGGITETDVVLAAASDAIIIGFNVRPQPKARQLAEKEKVEIKTYRVIYQAIDDINAARVGLLKPEIVEEDTGAAEVRELFKVPKVGTVAGCFVTEGEIGREDRLRVVRDGAIVFEGAIDSLRRFKEDVKSVKSGYECGIGIAGFSDVKIGDTLEGYQVREVAREG